MIVFNTSPLMPEPKLRFALNALLYSMVALLFHHLLTN